MSGADLQRLAFPLRLLALAYGAILCALLALLPLSAQAAPPSSFGTGWVQLFDDGSCLEGYCATLAAGEGVEGYQIATLQRPDGVCGAELSWQAGGIVPPGGPLYFPVGCWTPDTYEYQAEFVSEQWVRALMVQGPDDPASAPTGEEPLSSEAGGLVMILGGLVCLAGFAGVGAARWLV